MITCPSLALDGVKWRCYVGATERVIGFGRGRCGDGGGGSEAERTRRCFWIPLCLCSFSSELDDIRIDDIATNR